MSQPPVPAVIAVVLRDGELLLARRANPPDAGLWGFPGGKIERGETLAEAAERELREETGILAKAVTAFTALDVLDRSDGGELRYHYILIVMLCRWLSGDPVAGDDAAEVRWFPFAALDPASLPMSRSVIEIARQALALADRN